MTDPNLKFSLGQVVKARVTSVEQWGAGLEISPGVDALLFASHPSYAPLTAGQMVEITIDRHYDPQVGALHVALGR